ncbi:hypothetical protein B0H11DRAFT_1900506 [Mycena galericulata]|nr:hypothetical protein B0H11DRAFT_1900506 [Mycena galericulata]
MAIRERALGSHEHNAEKQGEKKRTSDTQNIRACKHKLSVANRNWDRNGSTVLPVPTLTRVSGRAPPRYIRCIEAARSCVGGLLLQGLGATFLVMNALAGTPDKRCSPTESIRQVQRLGRHSDLIFFCGGNMEPASSAHVDLPVGTQKITLSFLHDMTVPSTAQEAEQLLHLVRVHQNTCELNKNLALKKLHEALLYVQILRNELETADHSLSAASNDIGQVRAAIRRAGIRGVRTAVLWHKNGSKEQNVTVFFVGFSGKMWIFRENIALLGMILRRERTRGLSRESFQGDGFKDDCDVNRVVRYSWRGNSPGYDFSRVDDLPIFLESVPTATEG